MSILSRRFVFTGPALAALVVAAVAAPAPQLPATAKVAAAHAAPAIIHAVPASTGHGATPDIVHGFP